MRILLTAFEPYDEWSENSSWLAMVELLREGAPALDLVTRRYPVNLLALKEKLGDDLQERYDAVLHLGQAPGAASIKLEAIAVNVAGCIERNGEELSTLVDDGPLAFRSQMPLGSWVDSLRRQQIPATVSYHAGTFLCNAIMYLTHLWYQVHAPAPPVGFVHLPLASEQVASMNRAMPSLPTATLAAAIKLILDDLAARDSGDNGFHPATESSA